MRNKFIAICSSFIAASIVSVASATPPNTTAANSVPYEVGQGWVTHYFDEATQTRWFRFGELRGRSYCVEAVQGSVSPIQLDPNLSIYSDAGGQTLLSSATTNNDGEGDPYFLKGARVCYISPLTGTTTRSVRSIKLNVPITAGSGDAGNIRLRVVETTLFAELGVAPIFWGHVDDGSGGTYPVYRNSCGISLSNTSDAPIKVWASTVVNANQGGTWGCGLTGVIAVPHTGAPGTVIGSATVYMREIHTAVDSYGYTQRNLGDAVPVAVVPLRPR